jgi:hypothetical protein
MALVTSTPNKRTPSFNNARPGVKTVIGWRGMVNHARTARITKNKEDMRTTKTA